MNELIISIEILELEINDIQGNIGNPFRYGRSPSDKEFREIADFGRQLLITEAKLEFAKELLDSIVSNKTTKDKNFEEYF